MRKYVDGKYIDMTNEEIKEIQNIKPVNEAPSADERLAAIENEIASYKKELATVKGSITKLQNELKEVKNND